MIYLDIDGCVIPEGDPTRNDMITATAFACAQRVRRIAVPLDMYIVLCSHRRRDERILGFIYNLGLRDLIWPDEGKWCTPFLDDDEIDPDLSVRGQEIAAHMRRWNIEHHLVIDDMPALVSPVTNQIQPDPKIGITEDHVFRALALLS